MTLRDRAMGQRGHALEIAVENLFAYNGFRAEPNVRTKMGEIDVKVESDGFDAVIECKEYNPRNAASVTRDIISNIAKKAELLKAKNAILVTTKPPSDNLLEYARTAGVVVRSHTELNQMREALLKMQAQEERRNYLVNAFELVNDLDNAKRRKRQEWLGGLAELGAVFGARPRFKPERKPKSGFTAFLEAMVAEPPKKKGRPKGKAKAAAKGGKKRRRKKDDDDIFGLGSLSDALHF